MIWTLNLSYFFPRVKSSVKTRWSSPLAYTSSGSRVKSLTVKEEPLFTEVISKVHLLRGKDFKQKAKSNVILFHKDENISIKERPLICYRILQEWLSKCIFPLHFELWQWNVSWRPTVLVKHQHREWVSRWIHAPSKKCHLFPFRGQLLCVHL